MSAWYPYILILILVPVFACTEPEYSDNYSLSKSKNSDLSETELSQKGLESSQSVGGGVQNEAEGSMTTVLKEIAVDPTSPTIHDVFFELPKGEEQRQILCSRSKQDRVRDQFCGQTPPSINGLVDLQKVMDLDFVNSSSNGGDGNPEFVLTGHSSSLVARETNAINPRAIIFKERGDGDRNDGFKAMGFVRGDQLVELISEDTQTGVLSFFLVVFEQACNRQLGGCTYGDLLTPDIESNWTGYTLYEDDDLQNTILDCKQCHQPGGPGSEKITRMQELTDPWTHFFRDNRRDGRTLLSQYRDAKGTEDFAGIPGRLIDESDPARLEDAVRDLNHRDRSTEFLSDDIRDEVRNRGFSKTWQKLYQKHEDGEIIAPPHFEAEINDVNLLEEMASDYRAVMNSQMPKANLPDIRKTHDPEKLRTMGFGVSEGLTDGGQIIKQACGQCHNSALNRLPISRSKFNAINLLANSEEELQIAIQRLVLSYMKKDLLKAMPPLKFKQLTDEEIALAIEALGGDPKILLKPEDKRPFKRL